MGNRGLFFRLLQDSYDGPIPQHPLCLSFSLADVRKRLRVTAHQNLFARGRRELGLRLALLEAGWEAGDLCIEGRIEEEGDRIPVGGLHIEHAVNLREGSERSEGGARREVGAVWRAVRGEHGMCM